LLNSNKGELGVPKQLTPNTSFVDVDTTVSQLTPPTISVTDTPPKTPIKTQTNTSDESVVNWYYVLPLVGLVIFGFLVYRLKQQNLKSL
jgi:hypothetical protein